MSAAPARPGGRRREAPVFADGADRRRGSRRSAPDDGLAEADVLAHGEPPPDLDGLVHRDHPVERRARCDEEAASRSVDAAAQRAWGPGRFRQEEARRVRQERGGQVAAKPQLFASELSGQRQDAAVEPDQIADRQAAGPTCAREHGVSSLSRSLGDLSWAAARSVSGAPDFRSW